MMSVEPGLVDANVLVYAMDAGAPQHRASRDLLDAARASSTTLYVTSQILCVSPIRAPLTTHCALFQACSCFFMCCQFQLARWKGGWTCFAVTPLSAETQIE